MTDMIRSSPRKPVGHRDNLLYQRFSRPVEGTSRSTSAIWLVSMDAMIDRVSRPAVYGRAHARAGAISASVTRSTP